MNLDPPHDTAAVEPRKRRIDGIIDVLIAGASATAITVSTSVAAEPTNESSTVAAYVLGIVMGGLLLFRRQQPVLVLILSLVTVMGYNLTDFPSVSPIWPLLIPLYTVARTGQLLIGVAVGASSELISVGWVLTQRRPSLELLDGVVRETAVLAVVLVAGTALRNGSSSRRSSRRGSPPNAGSSNASRPGTSSRSVCASPGNCTTSPPTPSPSSACRSTWPAS